MATGPLSEDQIREKSPVTLALAGAGYMFSMINSDLGLIWELSFNSEDSKGIVVEVQWEGAWITIVSDPKVGKPSPELALELMRLNSRLVLARTCTGKSGNIIVVSQFQRDLLTSTLLRTHIQAAQFAVMDARKVALDLENTEQATTRSTSA